MNRFFVTGGAGFIGAAFVRLALEELSDCSVVNFDALTYAGNLDNLEGLDGRRHRFVRGDICDPEAVLAALEEGADAIINFAAESVVADTFVPAHFGHGIKLTTIEELFESYGKKTGVIVDSNGVQTVEIRQPLKALSFRHGMGQWKQITHITRHRYTGHVVTLRQKWGAVTVTPNHSVYDCDARLVAAETNPEVLSIRKINVDRSRHRNYVELQLPDAVNVEGMLYAKRAGDDKRLRSTHVRRRLEGESLLALTRFLGAYIAEGSALFNQANGQWQVCISNYDLEFLKQLQRDAATFSDARSCITLREPPGAHQLVFGSKIFYQLVSELCGKHAHEKQVPNFLYNLCERYKRAFWDCYVRGDGWIERYKTTDTHRVTTNSPKLAAGLGLLLSMVGIDYSLNYRDFPEAPAWRSAFEIKTVSSYDARTERKYHEGDYEGFVYDLTVEESHNFAAGIGNVVVHNTHVDRSIHSADEFIRTNVFGTQVLLDAARARGVRRFVQVSTDEVMGSLPERDDAFFNEESPFAPNSPYSASKAAAEHLVRAAHHTHGLDCVVTRCGNNYGPRQFPEKFLPLMLSNAMRDEPVPVYGDGRNVRDWIYVEDHCRAILAVLERGRAGEVYNIGARNVRRNIEVAESVLKLLGKPRSLLKFVKDRPGHDRRYAIDPTKVETELGWRPREIWESGLEKTIRWYAENADWVERARSGAYREYYEKQYGTI
jgi:dTDP-glucose 4,6-dehydratase